MRGIIVVIAAALLFAGCIGKEEPLAETAIDDAPTRAGAAAPTDEAAKTEDVPGVDQAEEEATLVAVPFKQEGQIAAAACLPAEPNSCVGPGIGISEDTSWVELEGPGRLTHATLTLTWEASSPTTGSLRFLVQLVESCGDGCTQSVEAVGDVVSGASPLALDVDLPVPGEGQWFAAIVYEERFTPDPVYMYLHPDQPFTIEGTLTAST